MKNKKIRNSCSFTFISNKTELNRILDELEGNEELNKSQELGKMIIRGNKISNSLSLTTVMNAYELGESLLKIRFPNISDSKIQLYLEESLRKSISVDLKSLTEEINSIIYNEESHLEEVSIKEIKDYEVEEAKQEIKDYEVAEAKQDEKEEIHEDLKVNKKQESMQDQEVYEELESEIKDDDEDSLDIALDLDMLCND
ncbi:TPA: hypothetical protein ACSVPQ_002754 [Clostridioides difficile]|uniref:hypothetical protein n=1 Tax=Clostridioides TaxID=1870884 RepID=UPI001D120FAB|nr:hypothetical protein [Clostridioides difficile]MCW0773256.1 hypothetical protein [Clostridioides difficile]MCW0912395.1 hypothetical protein [Clostridioides difficile]MDI2978213.1 hypothetical protein [Clostridioides difficile]MDI6151155.1 hypothetical protein [Clostridioides difficile]MDI7827606.1 hypothetical protein [Clostridioides difficile]